MTVTQRQQEFGGRSATSDVLLGRDIHKAYRKGVWPLRRVQPVLRGAAIDVARGEVVGLVGENGSGKSTLMKILVGALAADAGHLERSGTIGYCPQEPLLYPRLTCNEHFELFARAYGMTREREHQRREAIYDSLGFSRYADARADQLSGGTLAKLNLGLALLPEPDLLMLDEPYAGFDWDTYQKFWGIVEDQRAARRSVLIISHFVADQQRFDRIVEIRDGRTEPR